MSSMNLKRFGFPTKKNRIASATLIVDGNHNAIRIKKNSINVNRLAVCQTFLCNFL